MNDHYLTSKYNIIMIGCNFNLNILYSAIVFTLILMHFIQMNGNAHNTNMYFITYIVHL
jgi:hypothetical protein